MSESREVIYSSPEKCFGMSKILTGLLCICIIVLALVRHPIGITVGILGIVVIAPFLVCFIWRWRCRMPAITISGEGIRDTAWVMSSGMIYWDEVAGVEVVRYMLSEWLLLKVEAPGLVMSRMPMGRRVIMRIKRWLLPSPFMIPASTIEVSPHEVLEKMRSYYSQNMEVQQ